MDEESIRCANGTEVGRCYTTADCGENFVCSYGVCSPPCTCTGSNCRGPPCDEEKGWYCDPDSLGCAHDSVVNITDDGSSILNTNCSLNRDCNHYNLYCNQKTGKCHFLSRPEGEVRCTVTDISKCGFNGECLNGRCDCIRNGADECVASEPPVSCQSDRYLSCPANLQCHEMHDLCACPLGTILLGSECIEMTGKDGSGPHFTPCGMHSQCSANSSCVSGNCYPHCTDVCTENSCFSCIEGLCALGCTTDSDCDVNQFCEANSKACSTRCTNHSECARGQYCEGGQCVLSCIEGYECGAVSVCRRHVCVRTCTLDNECPQACVQGICGLSCKSSVDCAPGESCQMGLCLDSCTQDDSCAPTQVCIQGYCSKKCKAYADGCREECADNSQCAENLQCHEGVCAGQCSVDINCGDGFSCINGLCRISCSGSDLSITYCPSHLFCDFSTELCQTTNGTICLSPSDCTNTQYCHGQLCKNGVKIGTSCLSHSDCGVEEYCVDSKCDCLHGYDGECVDYPVSCTSDVGASACADRLPGSECDPVRNWCICELPDYQRLGDRCASPILETCIASCEPGYECRGKRCYQLCAAENSDCPAGLTCVNGYCDYECSKDSNCNLQQKCECGMCVHICSSNSDCLTGQRCHDGVCREVCSSTGLGSPCRPNYQALCTRDADCPPTGFCFNSYCQDGCTRGDVQCSTFGFSCQDDVCLKICDSEVSCLLLDSQVETGCGCPNAGISYDDCLLYSPFCPPTRFLPDGFTLTKVDNARECDELISNSVCDDETGQCVCPRGMVQYGGAVCQLALNGCDEEVLCELADICLEGYCFKRCSRSSDCPSKTYCSQTEGVCLLQCLTDDQCLGYQTCQEDGYCLSNPGYVPVDKAQDPQCVREGDRYKCPKDLFENCVDGECECLDGMQRSTVNLECELKIDTVCLKCDPCLDGSVPCADANMYCNIVRLCICKKGFKLDDSGEVCVKDDEPVSEIDCRTDADCVRLPNSYCNSNRGKCQCLENHCYDEKYCRLDVNECTNTTCAGDSTCVEMDCVGPSPGTCVPEKYLTAIPTTKFICAVDEDCFEYLGPYSYCFAERCTCVVTTSLLIDGACQPIGKCSRDIDCPPTHRCNFGLCLAVPDLPSFDQARQAKVVLKKTDYVGIIVACVLAVGLVALVVVTIYLRNEYYKKNAAVLDEKEDKKFEMTLETRKSQIAVKRDALETKRIASQATVAVPLVTDEPDLSIVTDVMPIPQVNEPLDSKPSTQSTRATKKTKSGTSTPSKKVEKSSEKLDTPPNPSLPSLGLSDAGDKQLKLDSKSIHSTKSTKSKHSKSSAKTKKSKRKDSVGESTKLEEEDDGLVQESPWNAVQKPGKASTAKPAPVLD
ncbi:cell death abnormality protein 1-like [Watersipora subatra]|uniref:cell death abnormality protein 1-like n=1 Tax=Watersipora subatra TaxID=2589382 RepID=UPI00355C167A